MSTEAFVPVAIDSNDYRWTFFGILNAEGQFWSPLAFHSEAAAKQHIINFWGLDTDKRGQCLATHKIVPVRIRLETLPEEASRHVG